MTPSSRASPWPRIAARGVFSSWLTESRNVRSALRARSRSSASLLNEAASVATSVEPVSGRGPGRSPAASARLASDTRSIGRETARASRNAATAAMAAPTAAAIANATVKG